MSRELDPLEAADAGTALPNSIGTARAAAPARAAKTRTDNLIDPKSPSLPLQTEKRRD